MMHSTVLLFFGNLFSSDGIIIVIIALVIFGGDKLPEIARGLGKGIRDFKDATEGVKREINSQIYSYEEKKEEKKIEEQIRTNEEIARNQQTESSPAIRPLVENTVPVSDSIFNEGNNDKAENLDGKQSELVTENHADAQHTDSGTSATNLNK
jgi:sec-independent protein translocase protein TatA